MRGETVLGGVVFAVFCYVLYAVSIAARSSFFILFPIFLVYSPIPGVYSFLQARRTKSLRRALSMGIVVLLLFDALIIADSLLRWNLVSTVLLTLLPALALSLFPWALAGTLWPGDSDLNRQLHIYSLALSRALSIILSLSGFFIWYVGVLMPFLPRIRGG